MKVKVGDKIYDSEFEPVMVILTEGDKKNITNMYPKANKYCVYPDGEEWTKDDHKKIKDWMKISMVGEIPEKRKVPKVEIKGEPEDEKKDQRAATLKD